MKWCGFNSLFILLCMAWSVVCWNTFPKTVCRIISFICKNIFECQKRKAVFFYIYISIPVHLSHSSKAQVQFKLRERDFFCLFFFWSDGSAGCLFLSFRSKNYFSIESFSLTAPDCNTNRDKIFPLIMLGVELILETFSHTNVPVLSCWRSDDRLELSVYKSIWWIKLGEIDQTDKKWYSRYKMLDNIAAFTFCVGLNAIF